MVYLCRQNLSSRKEYDRAMCLLKPYILHGIQNLSEALLSSLLCISRTVCVAFLTCLQQTSTPWE